MAQCSISPVMGGLAGQIPGTYKVRPATIWGDDQCKGVRSSEPPELTGPRCPGLLVAAAKHAASTAAPASWWLHEGAAHEGAAAHLDLLVMHGAGRIAALHHLEAVMHRQ